MDDIDISDKIREIYLKKCIESAKGGNCLLSGTDTPENCTCCGESIPPARVAALPGCVTCIQCQIKIEKTGVL